MTAPDTDNTEADSTDTDEDMDPCVLAGLDPVSEVWDDGLGHRLYCVTPDERQQVYAVTEYERQVSQETGELVETETVVNVGFVLPRVSMATAMGEVQEVINDRSFEVPSDENVAGMVADWSDRVAGDRRYEDVAEMCNAFQGWVRDRTDVSVESGGFDWQLENGDELRLVGELRVAEVADGLAVPLGEAAVLLGGLAEVSEFIRAGERFELVVPVTLQRVGWTVRALEQWRCGVMPSFALGEVAAMLEMDGIETQQKMADLLDKDPSTVSQQVQRVRELLAEARWSAENVSID